MIHVHGVTVTPGAELVSEEEMESREEARGGIRADGGRREGSACGVFGV